MSAQLSRRERAQARSLEPAAIVGRAAMAWYRIRLAVQDMNYAARRIAELQAAQIASERRSGGES